jgi:uncharacterized protein YeaO (DUF488 family)
VSERAVPVPLVGDSVLERLLTHLHAFRPRGVQDHQDIVRAWMTSTEPGLELRRYCADEASLLDAAADRLNLSGDVDLRDMARELANAAERLRKLAGVRQDDGVETSGAP